MKIILTPTRREAHTVKFPDVDSTPDNPITVELTFEPKVPTEVAPEYVAQLRDDLRAGVLLVCRQDKATGRVEFAHKLSKLIGEANEAEVAAIVEGEAVKARLAEQLATAPAPTERTL